ncbi:RNA polymerase sigma factor [Patescibacteria group bacterium]
MNKREFSHFYTKNIDPIYRFVYFRVNQNHDVAEDLVSEIFIKALNHFDKYDFKQSKSAWLYTIARNHLINHYRDQKQMVDLDEISNFLSIKEDSTETEIEIDKFLAYLSNQEQELVTFRYLLGYKYSDLAEIFNMKSTAVRVATHRAMKKLKKYAQD